MGIALALLACFFSKSVSTDLGLACGACYQTNGLDDSKPPRDADSGQDV